MCGAGEHALTFGRLGAALAQADDDPFERVTRRNLCVTPLVDVATDARLGGGARGRALLPQARQPRLIDRLERQRRLKPYIRCRIELTRRFQRLIAFETCPITGETQRLLRRVGGVCSGPLDDVCLELCAARRAEDGGARRLELAAWKANPFFFNDFRDPLDAQLRHEFSLAAGGDRSGHLNFRISGFRNRCLSSLRLKDFSRTNAE